MSTTTGQEQFKVIGTRPIRHDGVDKVTGRAKYGADYSFPDMLHGKVLRSPHAHARIKSINIEKALALPGVKAIVTGEELPELPNRKEAIGEILFNPHDCSHNVLARDKVLYNGHAIAAVAATSPHIAEEAVELIEVEYEPLPAVTERRGSDGARRADSRTRSCARRSRGDRAHQYRLPHPVSSAATCEAGFKAADFIVEREFNTAMVHQGYIEPHNAVGIYNSDGHATVYCSTQAPFERARDDSRMAARDCRSATSKSCRRKSAAASAARPSSTSNRSRCCCRSKTGAPVKMVMSRADVLRASGPTSGLLDQGQDGRHQGRQDHRGGDLPGVRGRRLPGFAGRRRRDDRDSLRTTYR